MSYRDDLDAGRHRQKALEERLAEQERELARLRAGVPTPAEESAPSTSSGPEPTEPDPDPSEPPRKPRWSFVDLVGNLLGGFVVIGLPVLGVLGPCVFEVYSRLERADRAEAAARDEALFTRKATIVWNASVVRTEGIYLPPSTPCRVTLDARTDGKRLRGELTATCGSLTLFKDTVDQVSCQLEEGAEGGMLRYRARCLPQDLAPDGARLLDLDTRLHRAEVRDSERKGYVVVRLEEWSEDRRGSTRLF